VQVKPGDPYRGHTEALVQIVSICRHYGVVTCVVYTQVYSRYICAGLHSTDVLVVLGSSRA
jgi:hypothetical protein